MIYLLSLRQSPVETQEVYVEVSYPMPRDVWGAPPSLKNIQHTILRHYRLKKNSKTFSPEGRRENVSPDPDVGLTGLLRQ